MLKWALLCAVMALLVAVLGLSGAAPAVARIARWLLALFLAALLIVMALVAAGWSL